MIPIIHIELTGKTIRTILAVLAVIAVILAVVWLIFGPLAAIAGGIAVVLTIRGLITLFR